MKRRRLIVLSAGAWALTFTCLGTVSSPCIADVSYVAQARQVSARAAVSRGTANAPDFGPFNQSVSVGNADFDRGSSGGASQHSTLAPSRIDVIGGSSAAGGWQAASGEGRSEFDVTFSVDARTRYSLLGFWHVDASARYYSDVAVEFSGPGGIIFTGSSLAANVNDRQPVRDYALEGMLAPGVYRLRAHSRSGAGDGIGTSGSTFGFSLLMPPSEAGCSGRWSWGAPAWEPDAAVFCMAEWDADGPGGESPRLLVGGEFTALGDVPAGHVSTWSHDLQQWIPVGSGVNGDVRCLLTLPDGSFVAGGAFTQAGGIPAARIARWNGTTWSPMGEGSGVPVNALARLPDGSIVAAGDFATAVPGVSAKVGRWDGTRWTPLGGDELAESPLALAVHRDGTLIAGGGFYFIDPNDVVTIGVAAWDGTRWRSIGDDHSTLTFALAASPNGDVVSVDLNGAVRRWNGSAWTTIPRPSGFSYAQFYAVAVASNGDIYAAGDFDFQQPCCNDPWRYPVLKWDGTRWTTLDDGLNQVVRTLLVDSTGRLTAGGAFTHAADAPFDHLARWDGAAWKGLPDDPGVDGEVFAIVHDPSGSDESVILGGTFSHATGRPVAHIARRHAGAFEPLGEGINGHVYALLRLPGGDLVAAGLFDHAGDVAARSIARWDGVNWHPLGAGLDGTVNDLALLPDGRLVAGGTFPSSGGMPLGRGLAVWDGATWATLDGGVNNDGLVSALAITPDGDLLVGGRFHTIGGVPIGSGIARRVGAAWRPLDGGVDGTVYDIVACEDGSVVAGGEFDAAGGVITSSLARWDGASWSAIGGGVGIGSSRLVRSLVITGEGDLVIGGHFRSVGNMPAPFLARWDGSRWSTPDDRLDGPVFALAALPDGSVAVGGRFTLAGTNLRNNLARFIPGRTPMITLHPEDIYACRGEAARLLGAVAHDDAARWEVELPPRFGGQWVPLSDGPLPAAASSQAMVAGADSPTLTLSMLDPAAALRFRLVASNACGMAASSPSTVGFCPGDHNCDGGVDGSDIESFFDAWENGSVDGDVDGDGAVDGRDVEFFFDRWGAGC